MGGLELGDWSALFDLFGGRYTVHRIPLSLL